MKNRLTLFVIIAVVTALFAMPTGAQAQSSPTYTVTINPGTCTNTSYNYTGNTAWTNFPSPNSLTFSRSANGVVINSGTISPSTFSGSNGFSWTENQSGYPSATQPYAIQNVQTFSYGGSVFLVATWNLTCSGGAVTGSVTVTLPGSAAPVLVPGPSIPAGFVLKTITCDVAVFDAPGGTPVGSNAIKAGQTWFVNPKSVKAADDREWTEVFVSSPVNGYIPTSCVS